MGDYHCGILDIGPYFTRSEPSCRTFMIPDSINFAYLPYQWQQPDYRPLHYKVDSRQNVKDYCRLDPQDYMGTQNPSFNRWKCQQNVIYPRPEDPYQLAPSCHPTNTVFKLV